MACLHIKHVRNVETPSRMLVAKLCTLSEDLLHLRVILPAAASACPCRRVCSASPVPVYSRHRHEHRYIALKHLFVLLQQPAAKSVYQTHQRNTHGSSHSLPDGILVTRQPRVLYLLRQLPQLLNVLGREVVEAPEAAVLAAALAAVLAAVLSAALAAALAAALSAVLSAALAKRANAGRVTHRYASSGLVCSWMVASRKAYISGLWH
jgi:hypothetical protein